MKAALLTANLQELRRGRLLNYVTNSTRSCITIILALLNHLSGPLNGRWVKWKKRSRADSELLCLHRSFAFSFWLLLPSRHLLRHLPSKTANSLRKPGRSTVSRCRCRRKYFVLSINSGTRTGAPVKRPEVARWKSHGDQAQIATLLGVVIAEGFIAMESEDSTEVKDLGRTVLALARGLGVGERALRRSRSIMELADKNEWAAARQEWDGVLSDIEGGMIELKSTQLAQLVSVGGWLRGTEALSALVLQKHSPERSDLIRQPGLVDYLEKQLLAMSSDIRSPPDSCKAARWNTQDSYAD